MPCSHPAASSEYADFIIRYFAFPQSLLSTIEEGGLSFINSQFAVVYRPVEEALPITLNRYSYSSIPNLYTLLDASSMESSGILASFSQPSLNTQGENTIIGIIDTGIDYRNPVFLGEDRSTRILGIWDQTIELNESGVSRERAGQLPEDIFYGTAYTKEDIDRALASDSPLDIVPSTDENGHGTFLAGIAAGRQELSGGEAFTGAAPRAFIAAVKLKPAKQYLRDYYVLPDSAEAYQENDIMMGVSYLYFLARKYSMPLVVCIPLGTNMGSHMGMSRLGQYLNQVSLSNGSAVITAAGNETGARHHFRAVMDADTDEVTAELRVGEREAGFSMELWAENMGAYTVGFISPTGEVAREISVPLRGENTVSFLLEQTQITVYTQIADVSSGSQFIFMRFENPMSGIWRILIRNSLDIRETFHIWLPVRGFISDETYFLRPDPDTTITDPGNARYPITVTAYDHTKNSIYIHASRGYSLSGRIKPDLAAPGVNILGASVSGRRLTRMSGTSVSAAHLAGAAAILLNWGVLNANYPYLNTPVLKSIFVRGAQRNPALTYPNREFGYGTLNLYEAFLHLRNL